MVYLIDDSGISFFSFPGKLIRKRDETRFIESVTTVNPIWITIDPSTEIGQRMKSIIYDWNYFLLYFEWLGLWICEEDVELKEQSGTKSDYYTSKITITSFGLLVMPILLFSRNIEAWNIGVRREGGEIIALPGSRLESALASDLTDEEMDVLEKNIDEDQSNQPFFEPFTNLFSKEELQNTLPRNRLKFTEGLYTFNVSLTGGTWRKVALSATHTMENLHAIILRAFQFEDDHLYFFFMDDKKCYKIQICSLDLVLKQEFLYVFDYGDEWTFIVEVEQINEHAEKVVSPFVKEFKGKAPDQYMDIY